MLVGPPKGNAAHFRSARSGSKSGTGGYHLAVSPAQFQTISHGYVLRLYRVEKIVFPVRENRCF